jgi:hypothetical protein
VQINHSSTRFSANFTFAAKWVGFRRPAHHQEPPLARRTQVYNYILRTIQVLPVVRAESGGVVASCSPWPHYCLVREWLSSSNHPVRTVSWSQRTKHHIASQGAMQCAHTHCSAAISAKRNHRALSRRAHTYIQWKMLRASAITIHDVDRRAEYSSKMLLTRKKLCTASWYMYARTTYYILCHPISLLNQ